MKKRIVILMCGIIFFSFSTVEAQSFGNKLKNKVLNKIENKADEKIDKSINSAVDKPVDKTEEKVKESVKSDKTKSNSNSNSNSNNSSAGSSQDGGMAGYSEEDIANMMQMMENMNTEVQLSDFPDQSNVQPSPFVGSFDMVIEDYKKNGSLGETTTISWYVDKFDMAMIPETKDSRGEGSKVIMNRKKGLMIVLTGGNTGMVMKTSDIGNMVGNSDYMQDDIDDVKVQVFKNITEVIEGKKCYKVVVSDDETESTAWVTENLGVRMDQLFGYMGMQSKGENKYEEKFGKIQGFAMKVTSIDKSTGEKTVMLTKNIKQGSIPAGMTSTEGYKLTQMPDMSNMPFMNQGKE